MFPRWLTSALRIHKLMKAVAMESVPDMPQAKSDDREQRQLPRLIVIIAFKA